MKTTLIALTANLFAAAPALAATDTVPSDVAQPAPDSAEPQITVLATGSEMRVDQAGQPITVITSERIDALQGPDIARVLQQVPGVSITRNGGPGTFTGVRIRGAESEQVLVLVDGVRVEDVSAPSGGFDFGNLTTGGIARIDVLRGSNSVVWGSAAIGGVIAVTSKDIDGVQASAEGGSHDSFTGEAAAGLKRDAYALSFNGGYTRTGGISTAAVGTEADGYRQWRVGGKGHYNLTSELSLTAAARYADSHLDIDGYAAPDYTFGDTAEYQTTRQFFGRAGFHYAATRLTLDGGYALSDTKRDYFDAALGTDPQYLYRGRSQRVDLTGRVKLVSDLALDFGGDTQWSRYSGSFDAPQTDRLSSAHALLGWNGHVANLSAGLRVDDHSKFGTKWTFGANGSIAVTEELRLRASYGEGFKAPTLFQLLSAYGNAALVPERSRSYDAGAEYTSAGGAFRVAATVYRRDSRDLIAFQSTFVPPYGQYINIGKARAEGVEFELGARLSQNFKAQAAYTYDKARNLTPGSAQQGNDLARRPRHTVTTSVDWTSPLAGITFGADMRLFSDSFDNASNTVRLDGGSDTTLRASLPFGDMLEVYGRVENVFNTHVPTAAGYGTMGRTAYAGLRVRY